MKPQVMLGALLVAGAIVLGGGYLVLQKRGFEVMPMTTVGDAGLFRFLRHYGEIEVGIEQRTKGPELYSRHVAIDQDWKIGLAMLPGRGIGGDDLDSPFASHPAFLGWFDDGTPVIGHRLNATTVAFPDDIGFGSNSVEAGDSAWQLVCIPDAARSVHLIRLAGDVAPTQLASAVASVPTNARWSTPQINATLQFLIGPKEESYQQLYAAPTGSLRHVNNLADWNTYHSKLIARSVAVKPLLAKWMSACNPSTGVSMFYGSGSFSQANGRWEFRQRENAPGQGLREETMDRLAWLLASVDSGTSDAGAVGRLQRNGSALVVAEMMLRTQYMPQGSGAALAKRWLSDLPTPIRDTPELRNEFSRVDSVVNAMLRASFVPSMKAEADAFLDEVASKGPELLIETVLAEFVLNTLFDVPSDQMPTPEAFVAAVGACPWERVRAAVQRTALNHLHLPGYYRQTLYLDGETLRVRPAQ